MDSKLKYLHGGRKNANQRTYNSAYEKEHGEVKIPSGSVTVKRLTGNPFA